MCPPFDPFGKPILNRWRQPESRPAFPPADYLKVRAANQREYLLKHNLPLDEWLLGEQ